MTRYHVSGRHIVGTFALLFASSALIWGCKTAGGPAGTDIPVGEFASLTGGTATFGQSVHNGDVLAIEEINAGGGVLGKQIDLMTEDDQSKTEEAVGSVQKLISEKVVAILGEVA